MLSIQSAIQLLFATPVAACCVSVTGCASEPLLLHARMTEEEIRAKVDESFPTGSSIPEVNAGLDALNVSRRYRRLYAGPPPAMLVRVFRRRGYWPSQSGYDDVTYADLWFLFDDAERLEGVEVRKLKQRYYDGDQIDPPFVTLDIPPKEPPDWLRAPQERRSPEE